MDSAGSRSRPHARFNAFLTPIRTSFTRTTFDSERALRRRKRAEGAAGPGGRERGDSKLDGVLRSSVAKRERIVR